MHPGKSTLGTDCTQQVQNGSLRVCRLCGVNECWHVSWFGTSHVFILYVQKAGGVFGHPRVAAEIPIAKVRTTQVRDDFTNSVPQQILRGAQLPLNHYRTRII